MSQKKVGQGLAVRFLGKDEKPQAGESFVEVENGQMMAGEKRALVLHLHDLGWDRFVALIETLATAPASARSVQEVA